MKNLVELYCDVDDFCKIFIPQWQKQLLENGTKKRQRTGQMTTSEIMTIVVVFTCHIIVILKIITSGMYPLFIKTPFQTY